MSLGGTLLCVLRNALRLRVDAGGWRDVGQTCIDC